MGKAEQIDAELKALYDQVPDVHCKGLCTSACGPVDGGPRERARMARAGYRLPTRDQTRAMLRVAVVAGDTSNVPDCPALGEDGRCQAYEARPMICRVWGASDDMPCPWGCVPDPGERRLTRWETMALIGSAERAGSGLPPMTPAEVKADYEAHPKSVRREIERRRKAARPSKWGQRR